MKPPSRSPQRVQQPLPAPLLRACQRHAVRLTRFILVVSIAKQSLRLFGLETDRSASPTPRYRLVRRFLISTSRFGIGQQEGSNKTPLGLHRVAEKIGAGWPVGTVFRARQPVGFIWQGLADAPIAHRILWLEGLEPGFNRGGAVDTRRRYIYIHGLADEPTLGRPASRGCVHMAAADLIPLFDRLPPGTLVWIQE